LLITMYQVRDWSYEIQSHLPSTYTKRWLRWKLQPNRTIVQITFKVVIAYLSHQETDQLASWGRILLQISRSSHKTRMICITQKQVQPRIIKRIRLMIGLLKKPTILLPALIWQNNKLVLRLVQTR
jgi:hypothetical protein